MLLQTGWECVDNSIQLDGMPLMGIPSSHLTTIIDDDDESLSDELFSRIDSVQTDYFTLWIDLIGTRAPVNSENIVVVKWTERDRDMVQMFGLVNDVLYASVASAVVVERAMAMDDWRDVDTCLRLLSKCCVSYDAVGIFFSHESVDPRSGNSYWMGEKAIRSHSSYIIGPNREIVWSSVMPPKDGSLWKLA